MVIGSKSISGMPPSRCSPGVVTTGPIVSERSQPNAWHIGAGSAIIDGEVVIPAEDGTTDFSVLQNELKGGSKRIVMVAFDLLYLNGYDLLKLPLFERKALLKKIVFETDIQSSESFEIDGREMYKHACKTGLEGVVSKVRDSRYVSGRVNDWVKKTCAQRETLAIAGFALDGGKWDGLYLGGYHLIEMLRQSLFGLPDTRMSTTRTGSVAIATLCLLA
jgi:ATP-dependent DNA ligase